MGAGQSGLSHPLTLQELRRWEDYGATWRALELEQDRVSVEMCTCFGEPVDVLSSREPEVIEYIRTHADDN